MYNYLNYLYRIIKRGFIMKRIILGLFFLLISGFCFAQVKAFEINDIKDYEDIEDNVILINRTGQKIYTAYIYGIINYDNDFDVFDYCKQNKDGTYSFNSSVEKIATFKGLNPGKREKIELKKKTLKRYHYFVVYVEEPAEFSFVISDLREQREDLCITLEGKGQPVKTEYVYVEKTPSKRTTTTNTTTNTSSVSSRSSTDELVDTLQKIGNDLGDWGNGKCSSCNGTGVCKECKGSGKILKNNCWSCHGSGKCSACGGDGDWLH